ncbi:MAG: hypothetical protein B6I35_08560 [Anaerolineaceae bacterium 4572_32.2]|nr:MAG: hypothetical protein B6I35_08560 [Anaerolineaceae bacterium 4572_32.2]HEY73233.1 DUF11 domain-containing protein [Thermoflexia bacterium]
MKIYRQNKMRRSTGALLTGALALLLVASLSLLLSHFRALAQPEAGNLVTSKSVYPSSARPGDHLAYTVYITNTGDEPVSAAWMTDSLPLEVNYFGGLTATMGTPGRAGDVITWTGLLTPNDVVAIDFTVQITDATGGDARFSFANTAKITGAGSLVTSSVEATAIVTFEAWFPIIFYKYPPVPDLNDIPEPNPADNSFTVSWQAVNAPIDRYVLQESTDANFTSVTEEWETTATSQLVTKGTAQGALYYRVRADKDDRWGEGPWSAVKSVTLKLNYYDGFDSSSSGWRTHTADCCLTGCDDTFGGREHMSYKYNLYYSGGRYHVYIPTNCYEGGNHGFTRFVYPVSLAPGITRPSTETCIEMKGSFEKPKWVSGWGLVFAASADMNTVYSLWVDNRGDWGIVKRIGYQFPGPNYSMQTHEKRINIVPGVGGPRTPARPDKEVNTLRAQVTGNQVKLYVNGEHVHTFSEGDISSLNRVGIIGGNWEWGDTQIGYDYFYMDEGCDTY